MFSPVGCFTGRKEVVLRPANLGFMRNRFPHRIGRAGLTLARETMRDLEDGEINFVEGNLFTVLARRAFEEYANAAFLQFLLVRKPNAPEVLDRVEHLDPVKIAFGTDTRLPNDPADRVLSAANPLQMNLLSYVQRLFQKEAATVAADIHRVDNFGEMLTRLIGTGNLHAD